MSRQTDRQQGTQRVVEALSPNVGDVQGRCSPKTNSVEMGCDRGAPWTQRAWAWGHNTIVGVLEEVPLMESILDGMGWLASKVGYKRKSKRERQRSNILNAQVRALDNIEVIRLLHAREHLLASGWGPLLRLVSDPDWLLHSQSKMANHYRTVLKALYPDAWKTKHGVPHFEAMFGKSNDGYRNSRGNPVFSCRSWAGACAIQGPAFFKDVRRAGRYIPQQGVHEAQIILAYPALRILTPEAHAALKTSLWVFTWSLSG